MVHNYELRMSNHWCNRLWCRSRLLFPCMAYRWNSMSRNCHILKMVTCNQTYAWSFYSSQKVLVISIFFAPDQKLICVLCQSQTYCTRQYNTIFGLFQNILEPVEGQGINFELFSFTMSIESFLTPFLNKKPKITWRNL